MVLPPQVLLIFCEAYKFRIMLKALKRNLLTTVPLFFHS